MKRNKSILRVFFCFGYYFIAIFIFYVKLISDDQSHLDDEADLDLNAALNQLHRRLKAKLNESETKVLERLTFPDEVMIHTELSEELLKLLNDSDKINDVVMTLFEGDKTRLK